MMNSQPLRYRISDWHQLPRCKSNTSRALHVSVTDFVQDMRLSGVRISIQHDDFGTLFACVLHAEGSLVQAADSGELSNEFTTAEILNELSRYGFIVEYNPVASLKGSQISYLMTLQGLKFDKIRILNVYKYQNGVKAFDTHVVAFNVKENPFWLNNAYAVSESEFLEALRNGSAINISAISDTNKFDWSWLYGFVADIEDILEENAH